ncbi:MAG: UDP-N-acetylmuramyl-tripeptide synthetase [Pirellulales bacterium]|nr:UDP-N-acetylmuramyl-tripeptide synthetase [Pirellulales bacterium]
MLHSSHSSRSCTSLIRLDELFSDATRTGAGQVVATSCTSDWRQVKPGDVYVALPDMADSNQTEDGHVHARQAVSQGAIAVVCEEPVPVFDVPTYLVADSRVALGQLCQALVGNPSYSMPVIGVSGTHGKSTTLALLDSIFAQAGKRCGTLSSLGCYDGMSHSAGIGDSPSAPLLASRLARMEAAGCSHALLEVSSKSLSQARLAGIRLDSICVTHVTDAHLDWHNSIQNYRDSERRIFHYLAPEGAAILNADDPVSMQWLGRVSGPVLTYGLGSQAEVSARVIEQHANEQLFLLTAGSESAMARTAIVGEHHVCNCLAATALSLSCGIDLQDIAAGIEALEKLPGRMERIDCGQGYPVYVDAARTPGALSATLRTARQLAAGRVICVLGAELGSTSNEEYAVSQVIKRMADLAIVAGVAPQMEAPSLPSSRELACVEVVADRGEAIACAVAIAEPGDVVVIAGNQPGPQLAFGGSKSDADIARQLLYAQNETIRLAA